MTENNFLKLKKFRKLKLKNIFYCPKNRVIKTYLKLIGSILATIKGDNTGALYIRIQDASSGFLYIEE